MMEYLSFKIDKPKMCKQINAIKKDNKRQSCVYNAEYPPFAKKVVYKDTAISTDCKMVAGVVNEYEERMVQEFKNEYRLNRVMGGINEEEYSSLRNLRLIASTQTRKLTER